MTALVLAAVLGTGVPAEVVKQAEAVVAEVLQGIDGGKVKLLMFRTRAEMEAAVRRVARNATADFAAWYDYDSHTIFAFMAPRPDPALFKGGLPGLLLGALVHEAQHARGAFIAPDYRRRSKWRQEGEADRDTVLFLRESRRPGAGAWEFLLQSRRQRLKDKEITMPAGNVRLPRQSPGQLAAWYTFAFADAIKEDIPESDWMLMEGSAAPVDGGYRLVSEPRRPARIEWRGKGRLEFRVTPLATGKGQIDIYHGPHKIAFLRRGGVRAMWRRDGKWFKDPLHPTPPLASGAWIAFENGVVSVNGRVVLYVQQARGRLGIGVWDGAAAVELPIRPSAS